MSVMNKKKIIQLFNVSKKFGEKFALKDINLEIESGEFVFISGPAGSGKSVLLKVLYLAEKISEGKIIVDGMELAKTSSSKLALLRRQFGMVFHDFKLIHNLTVYENVALVLEAARKKTLVYKGKSYGCIKNNRHG